jgi:hypothetical protein
MDANDILELSEHPIEALPIDMPPDEVDTFVAEAELMPRVVAAPAAELSPMIDLAKCNFLLPYRPVSLIVPVSKVVSEFFGRKLGKKLTFQFKVFNALSVTLYYPEYFRYFGVQWISAYLFKVNKSIFGKLLSLRVINGSLFNRQGAFPTHGFEQVASGDLQEEVLEGSTWDVDNSDVRIIRHRDKHFHVRSSIQDLMKCGYRAMNEECSAFGQIAFEPQTPTEEL